MNNIKLRDIQLHQLKILMQLVTIFEKEKISYFAIGGTALGAIRHQGFIPWDDDIDIAIPRPDYDKFLTLQKELPKNLLILNHKFNHNYPLYFSKVVDTKLPLVEDRLSKYGFEQGIFIDIFPWDEIENVDKAKKALKKPFKLFKRLVFKKNGNLADKVKFLFYKSLYGFKDSLYFFNKIDEKNKFFSGANTGIWGYPTLDDVLNTEDIYPLRKVKFENAQIFIPNACEKYLTQKYGDYLKLPDVNDRVSHFDIAPD